MSFGRTALKWLGGLAATVVGAVSALSFSSGFGASPDGKRLERMKQSPRYGEDGFENYLPEAPMQLWKILKASLGKENTVPEEPIDVLTLDRSAFEVPPESGLRITWLGHSSFIVEIDGVTLLVDPVWGERTSPFSWLGPKRWYAPPLPLEELPPIDAVVISHDHYDHLDMPTVEGLKGQISKWVVPLGVGAHLERWGVESDQILELDWWDSISVKDVQLHCTPARHFSGRGVTTRNSTLWAGWALVGPEHRVFYSGDTALHPQLAEIGERLGPFDVTLVESGAYSPLWRDVHLGPEQAVIAHELARGKVLLPVHWGLFDLAPHSWVEPIQRVREEAERRGVTLAVPRPGGQVEPTLRPYVDEWWDAEVPWNTTAEAPQWSTGVEALIETSSTADEPS